MRYHMKVAIEFTEEKMWKLLTTYKKFEKKKLSRKRKSIAKM